MKKIKQGNKLSPPDLPPSNFLRKFNRGGQIKAGGMTTKCPSVYLKTFGCQMNVRDSEVIAGLLQKAGYVFADSVESADVVIFNTCSVRQHAEDKVWSEIGRIAKLSPLDSAAPGRRIKTGGTPRPTKKIVGLVGCMAQNYKEEIFERAPQVDFAVGPSDIHKIPEIIKSFVEEKKGQSPRNGDNPFFLRKIWETDSDIRPEEIYHAGFYEDREHTYIVISEGCSNFCSYCVVPHVRGQLHNRNYKDILKEIQEATDKGITKITLLGQNVCAYGVENSPPWQSEAGQGEQKTENRENISFIRLLEAVNKIEGLREVSFVTSHPKDTSIELFRAMQDLGKLKKYLHLPVQSGSDRILKLMNRGYTRKFYLDLIDNYRKMVKNAILTTDIIVGFPNETEEDFQDTYNLVKDIGFDGAYIFKYSTRPHTEAQKLIDDVPKQEKERRHKIILDLQKGISKDKRNE